ncbi:MAG: NADH-quinone oxidoreductase subunit M [Alphaproteobacteria bacterium]|nr:NADH-quinone oxidoreductase subunit M [Alphaproteobacteria bacterium]
MIETSILTAITFLPLIGALAIVTVPGDSARFDATMRWIALVTTLTVFAATLVLWAMFDPADPDFQFVVNFEWLPGGIGYRMGVDGISILLVVLTALLLPICVVASWQSITVRVREYMIAFLILETLMIGAFATLDLALFFVFFEGSLIPMFLIIGIWGGKRRVQASYKFFFYTFTGSVFMLIAIMAIYWQAGTLDIAKLLTFEFTPEAQFWLWLAFFASFAVKLPMWPFHRWLPEAHVEAPTAGSVILAAVLLKFGGYGFLRFSLPMFPDASALFTNFVFALSVVAIIATSLVALVQEDMKKLIAYSSVAHMGFVTMGIFSGTKQGVDGALFQMLSHGLVSGALFLSVGVIYDRMHTREISAYGGLADRMPRYATAFVIFSLANIGLPGTSGFIGEFLTLIAAFSVNTWVAAGAALGVILSAAYALWLVWRLVFGALDKDNLKSILDLSRREMAVLVPLIVLIIFFGFYPAPILDAIGPAVDALVHDYAGTIGLAAEMAVDSAATAVH